jgi:glycosyltransferase involved in cell wall biosynthesis
MKSKIAFIIPWYGDNIPGGAESLCRDVVKALLDSGVEVEILTTCVWQFTSDWNENFHPERVTIERGVRVRRFEVRPRDGYRFDQVNYKLMNNLPVTLEEEQVFVNEMINSPTLYEYIDRHRNEYVYLFIPYMFGTTYWGSMVCPERSILIPCLHDEAYAHMSLFRQMCERVRGLLFNSIQEQHLAQQLYALDPERLAVVGVPVSSAWNSNPARFKEKYGVFDFFLYAGRADKGKGADMLVDFYCRYLDETNGRERLVFIGGGDVDIPQCYGSRIVKLGFLPVEDKHNAYGAAIALCVPSVMESFSIVMMESWLAGRPVVANAKCPVTTDFCLQSNGGLYFADYQEFREILALLTFDQPLAKGLGARGREYVLSNFQPKTVAARYLSALEQWGF